MPTGQNRIGQYYSPRPHPQPNAGQPREFSSLDQLLRQRRIEYGDALSTDTFIRKAVPNISELNDTGHEGIEDFLMDVAPWRSAGYLVSNLRNADSVEPILRVLAHYRASKDTVMPLVKALGDNDGRVVSAAERALIGYGRAALKFIITPSRGTLYYTQLTEVIAAINSGQPGGVR